MATPRQTQPTQSQPSTPAAPPVPSATAAPDTPQMPSLRIRFSRPAVKADDGTSRKASAAVTVAYASLLGCFGALPLLQSGWGLARLNDRTMRVYVPAGGRGFFPHVEPMKRKLDEPIQKLDRGQIVDVDYVDDPDGLRAMKRLNDAIIDAWATANHGGADPFERDIPLAL